MNKFSQWHRFMNIVGDPHGPLTKWANTLNTILQKRIDQIESKPAVKIKNMQAGDLFMYRTGGVFRYIGKDMGWKGKKYHAVDMMVPLLEKAMPPLNAYFTAKDDGHLLSPDDLDFLVFHNNNLIVERWEMIIPTHYWLYQAAS